MRKLLFVLLVTLASAQSALALTVQVLGRDTPVTLDSPNFRKYDLPEGKAIKEIYFDAENQYVVYQERSLYQHRCRVPNEVIEEWVAHSQSDRYYHRSIDDKYGCNSNNTPAY